MCMIGSEHTNYNYKFGVMDTSKTMFTDQSKRQTIILMFLIFLLVVVSMGCEKKNTSSDPSIVASYEGGKITRKELEENIDKLVQRVAPEMIKEIKNKELYKRLIQSLAVDKMAKVMIAEKQLEKKDTVKHAMKHISEELNINEMHSRAHDNKIKVSENDIKVYYEENRGKLDERPLTEVKEDIREILTENKETQYFKNYLEDLKKNAVITREDRLLEVPLPSETDLTIYYEQNRKKYGPPEKSFSEVRDEVLQDLKEEKERDWFEQKKNRTLFTIHGKRNTVGEFYEEFKELPFYEQEKYQEYEAKIGLLDRLIVRLLIVEDTTDQMLDSETKEDVTHAKEDILRQLLHQEEVDDKLEIKDEEVKAYYEKHKKEFVKPPQMKISYIRISSGQTSEEEKRSEEKIEQAYKKLNPGFFQEGDTFEKVVNEFSEDTETAKNGGKLEKWISEGENIIEEIASHRFHENVMGLYVDEISPPFQFSGSWYIVKVRERKEPEIMTYKDVQGHIKQALLQQKHEELTYSMSETLLKQTNLVIYDDVIESMLKTNK